MLRCLSINIDIVCFLAGVERRGLLVLVVLFTSSDPFELKRKYSSKTKEMLQNAL